MEIFATGPSFRDNGAVAGKGAIVEQLRVIPRSAPDLRDRDPGMRLGSISKPEGEERLAVLVERLGLLHNRLFAESTRSLLVVLQGMDASGKDGTIRHVLTGVSPQGCRVISFQAPTDVELAHDYLWRVHRACPARGEMAIFNRSHYEDVVAVRVRGLVDKHIWRRRYAQICAFERTLSEEGTAIVKIFLHVSRAAQARRLQERLDNPEKNWKFSPSDLDDRQRFDDFIAAYDDAIAKTSTEQAPWFVVPADHNWVRNLAVAEILVATLERLDPRLPAANPQLRGVTIT